MTATPETIVTTGYYKSIPIHETSRGGFIVEYAGCYYKVGSLGDAKTMIDHLLKTRQN